MFNFVESVLLAAFPVIFAITFHEAAHGYMARQLGDSTAWLAGRVSLNPLRHIDPIGTILVPAVILSASIFTLGNGLIFGWAKPVPVNFGHLRNPRRDTIWVALAGPLANLLMALFWALLLRLLITTFSEGASALFLAKMCLIGININLVLMVFNLLPLPPLDGGRIAVCLLPYSLAKPLANLERFGFVIVLGLLFLGFFERVLWPIVSFCRSQLFVLAQLNQLGFQ